MSARSRFVSSPNSTPEVRLSPKQRAFVLSQSRFPLYRGAIRSGKTYAGAIRSIDRRYRYPGTVQIIGGPSWDQLRDGTMITLRRLLNPRCIIDENKAEHFWTLDNGSMFRFRTLAEPDVLRSLEAHDLWIDEIAMCPGGVGGVLDVAMPRISLPCDDPSFHNSLWGTTTPRGLDWTLGVWGANGKPGYEVVHSTIYDNRANLPDGLIESLEEQYRDTPFFEQELLGEYTAFEGLVYPMFHHDKHVRTPGWMLADSEAICAGVDFGGTADPSAMVLIGEQHGRWHQFSEFYRVGATLDEMFGRLVQWCEEARIPRRQLLVAADPSGTVLLTSMAAYGFSAEPAARDKTAGLKLVAQRLTGVGGVPAFTISPQCPYTIAEYGQYVWARKRDGETRVVYFTKQPIDHHADAMDATRYALMRLAQRQPAPVPVRTAAGRVYYGG